MADEPAESETPKRDRVPWALRLTFTPVLLVIMMLIGIRMLNAISVYPPIEMDKSIAPKLAAERPDVTEVHFEADDGVKLYGWVLGAKDARRRIIACTGNGDYVGSIAGLYSDHAEALDAQFLLFDYRGYANSEGRPGEAGLYADARGAYRYAVHELGWKPTEIVLWGRSLGGAPAIKLAYDLVADGAPPRALVLEAPFTNIHDMAQVAMPALGKPEWLIYEMYDNLARAPKLTLPVFHYQGTGDEIIPFEQGETLFAALPGPKEHLTLEGVGHLNIWEDSTRGSMIRHRIDAFLRAYE
ncbi:MAG: alpha/beta hydrolase [Planctomycetes bacterium]|nr:alpha/beta hydrolase [Planctomycetota bacterium]